MDTLKRWIRLPVARALIALALMLVLGFIFNANGAFNKAGTHLDALRHISRYGILACGMTLVIVTGGIDLSVGSILGLSAVVFSMFTIHMGWPVLPAIAATLLAGAACGCASGAIIVKGRIQPFIATLAMMVFARGLAKAVSGGQKVSTAIQNADGTFSYVDAPAVFNWLSGRIMWNTVSMVTVIFALCAVACWLLLGKLRWGRYLYAVGGNEEAARLSGIPVGGSKLLVYGLSGLFSAIAGVCQAAQEMQGDPEAGQAYELQAIAIVVIGGTSLAGGRGGIWLTCIGALTIGYLEKILSINAVGEASRLMLTGLIIVCAVLFQRNKNRGIQ